VRYRRSYSFTIASDSVSVPRDEDTVMRPVGLRHCECCISLDNGSFDGAFILVKKENNSRACVEFGINDKLSTNVLMGSVVWLGVASARTVVPSQMFDGTHSRVLVRQPNPFLRRLRPANSGGSRHVVVQVQVQVIYLLLER
jgi:hypothetical protein